MKETAIAAEIPVFQPDNVNAPEALERLRQFQADLFVVAAYGQILKPEFLAIPPRGAFNIHSSLLPRHRGAAPINYAVLAGDAETGVSVFRIEPKVDAGPVVGMVRMTGSLAGMLIALDSGLDQTMAIIGLKAFPAALVGGLDSLAGALAGSLIVAAAEVLLIHYVDPLLSEVVPFLVLIAMLIVRPWGLFGTREELDRV